MPPWIAAVKSIPHNARDLKSLASAMKKIIKKTAAKAAPPGKSVKPSKPAPKRQSVAATKRTSTRATGSPPSAENYQHDGQAVHRIAVKVIDERGPALMGLKELN